MNITETISHARAAVSEVIDYLKKPKGIKWKNSDLQYQKEVQIDYDSNDRRIADYIMEREPSFKSCIECGGCSATCTSGNFTQLQSAGKLIFFYIGEKMQNPGMNIRKCMLCGKCSLVCPRGVNTRNMVFLAKQAFQKFDGHAV